MHSPSLSVILPQFPDKDSFRFCSLLKQAVWIIMALGMLVFALWKYRQTILNFKQQFRWPTLSADFEEGRPVI